MAEKINCTKCGAELPAIVESLVDYHRTQRILGDDYNTSPCRGQKFLRKEHRNGYNNH
jgi:hypothetical protein